MVTILVSVNESGSESPKAGGNGVELHLFDDLVLAAVEVIGAKHSKRNWLKNKNNREESAQ